MVLYVSIFVILGVLTLLLSQDLLCLFWTTAATGSQKEVVICLPDDLIIIVEVMAF